LVGKRPFGWDQSIEMAAGGRSGACCNAALLLQERVAQSDMRLNPHSPTEDLDRRIMLGSRSCCNDDAALGAASTAQAPELPDPADPAPSH